MAEGLLGRFARGGKQSSDSAFEVERSEAEWRAELSPQAYHVLREHGTERAGTSLLDKEHGSGVFRCAGCGQELFASDTKFNSGTGWPSFFAPLEAAVEVSSDRKFMMTRTEVHCRRCGGHLGHVFEDGPKPTGLRYCMNGAALDFEARPPAPVAGEAPDGEKT
jgi:peptide-methionine (R)-S-oxide reductase